MKKIALVLVMTLSINTIGASFVSASEGASSSKVTQISENEMSKIEAAISDAPILNSDVFDPSKMTESEKKVYNASIDKQVDLMKKKYGKSFDSKNFRENLVYLLETKNSFKTLISTGTMMNPMDGTLLPDVHLKNDYVAAAISVVIDAVLVTAGCGSIALFIKKVGVEEAKRIFTNSIKTKLIAWGCAALAGSLGYVVDYMLYLADPGKAAAEALDSIDDIPNNGYLDVIL